MNKAPRVYFIIKVKFIFIQDILLLIYVKLFFYLYFFKSRVSKKNFHSYIFSVTKYNGFFAK